MTLCTCYITANLDCFRKIVYYEHIVNLDTKKVYNYYVTLITVVLQVNVSNITVSSCAAYRNHFYIAFCTIIHFLYRPSHHYGGGCHLLSGSKFFWDLIKNFQALFHACRGFICMHVDIFCIFSTRVTKLSHFIEGTRSRNHHSEFFIIEYFEKL